MNYENAILFFKCSADQRQLAALGARTIIALVALWAGHPRRNPWVNGCLSPWFQHPERSAFCFDEIAADTGYKIGRLVGNQGVSVIGRSYELPREEQYPGHTRARKQPNIAALCAGKRPAFVEFNQAGYEHTGLFKRALTAASELVADGYYVDIRCYSDSIDNQEFDNHERCTISISEDGRLAVRIHWGDETLVGPLLDFCRAEKFTEEEGCEDYEKPRKTA